MKTTLSVDSSPKTDASDWAQDVDAAAVWDKHWMLRD
jgi:hypothetical protein